MSNKTLPSLKGRFALKHRGVSCLNCEHPLDISDRFCPNCSQANTTKKLKLKDFFDEFFASMFSYDSKVIKTLSVLILKPGKITKDYINGKRVSYTNPFRFFLSLSIIYFLMLNFSGDFSALDRNSKSITDSNSFLRTLGVDYEDELEQVKDSMTVVEAELKKELEANTNLGLTENDKKTALTYLDSLDIKGSIKKTSLRKKRKDSIIKNHPDKYFDSIATLSTFNRYSSKLDFFQKIIDIKDIYTYKQAKDSVKFKDTRENKIIFRVSNSFHRVTEQPGSFISEFISRLPFVIFFFMPVFAVFIWLIYNKKKFSYVDHLIFSFHLQTMLILLLILSFIIDSIFDYNLNGLIILGFLFYLYKGMRRFYEQKRFKTLVKIMFLNSIFFILAFVLALFIVLGSAAIY